MSNRYLVIAATFAAATAAPALASAPAAPARTATPAPAAQNQLPTRAQIIQNVAASFKTVDTNGDGVISQAELAAAEAKALQERVAIARQRVEAEFNKLDTNHDGQLSKAEFMAAAPTGPATPPNGADMMAQLDKNHDGKVTLDEFRAPTLARFDQIDTNHDGTISAAERQAAQAQAARSPRR